MITVYSTANVSTADKTTANVSTADVTMANVSSADVTMANLSTAKVATADVLVLGYGSWVRLWVSPWARVRT